MGGKKAVKATTQKQKKKGGGKKKVLDSFLRKEWYDIKAPAPFQVRDVGKTIANKTQGNKLAADSLNGRIFEVSQADLIKDSNDDAFRIFKLKVEDVQGKLCFTNFHGMRFTTDKIRSMVRKWHTLIEAHVDVKTVDGYILRVFALAFTKKQANQARKTAYAQSSQIKAIRKKMVKIIEEEVSTNDISGLIGRLTSQSIGKKVEKVCQSIYPLQNVLVSKVKVLKAPRTDLAKLAELHGGANAVASAVAQSQVVEREDAGAAATEDKKKAKKPAAKKAAAAEAVEAADE
jgi:small subunit ribosomal protein S3Ae